VWYIGIELGVIFGLEIGLELKSSGLGFGLEGPGLGLGFEGPGFGVVLCLWVLALTSTLIFTAK